MTDPGAPDGLRTTHHQADIAAPAEVAYALVAEAASAPLVFPGTVHVEQLERNGEDERLRIWAAYGDELRTWTSHRTLRPAQRSVTFQQDAPQPPVAYMRGEWRLDPAGDDHARATLTHAFRAIDDAPQGIAWIEELAEQVSTGQLGALNRYAALGGPSGPATSTFTSEATLRCDSGTACARVLSAADWAGQLPGVEHVSLRRADGDMRLLDLTVKAADGGLRTTQVALVALPGSRIAFKDMRPPEPIAAHVGIWSFEETAQGSRATVRHDVAVRYAAAGQADEAVTTAETQARARRIVLAASTAILRHLAAA
jgi:aromatase